jgi:hypothetical protein
MIIRKKFYTPKFRVLQTIDPGTDPQGTHETAYSIHPGNEKMYQDLKKRV